jgi:ABC-type taurine transport system ATPase subunit
MEFRLFQNREPERFTSKVLAQCDYGSDTSPPVGDQAVIFREKELLAWLNVFHVR